MVPMRYKILGDSGLRVSEFALGTMTFGEEWGWGSSKSMSGSIYDAFREAGGNFVDTSGFYTNGTSEHFLRDFIAADRENVILSTKYGAAVPGADPNAAGTHRLHLMQAVEASLRRLGTDRLDLFWVNSWDFMTPEHEVMRALDDLVRAGKILYVGISDAPAWIISRCNTMAELRGWTPFIAVQVQYNLIERTSDRELLPMARALDLGVAGCSPLAGGLLSGKYNSGGSLPRRLEHSNFHVTNARARTIIQTVMEIADQVGYRPSQIALAWSRDRGVIPLIGARTREQMTENLRTLEVSLSIDQTRLLDEVSAIELGFPHDFLQDTRPVTFGGMFERIDRHRDRGIGTSGVAARH